MIENDWLEAIVALPEQMFYNTGIGTYIWIVTNRKETHRKGKIQLIDARSEQFYIPMRRSLGDKRRRLGSKEDGDSVDQIGEIVRLYGQFTDYDLSKIFENADFGYNRVSIERPLRLLYQMNLDRKSRFLDAYPHLLDDIQVIDHQLGREPVSDWNRIDYQITEILKQRGSRWKANELKTFKEVFTDRSPEAEPVILKQRKLSHDSNARIWGWFLDRESRHEVMFETDTQLRDFENIPLQEDVAVYFQQEVLLHLPDSWVDAESIRSAYEINFNRYFTNYSKPRSLIEIDRDLKDVEDEILSLLREITE